MHQAYALFLLTFIGTLVVAMAMAHGVSIITQPHDFKFYFAVLILSIGALIAVNVAMPAGSWWYRNYAIFDGFPIGWYAGRIWFTTVRRRKQGQGS